MEFVHVSYQILSLKCMFHRPVCNAKNEYTHRKRMYSFSMKFFIKDNLFVTHALNVNISHATSKVGRMNPATLLLLSTFTVCSMTFGLLEASRRTMALYLHNKLHCQ